MLYSQPLNPSYLSKEVTAFVGSRISQCCELTYMYDSPEILLAFKHIWLCCVDVCAPVQVASMIFVPFLKLKSVLFPILVNLWCGLLPCNCNHAALLFLAALFPAKIAKKGPTSVSDQVSTHIDLWNKVKLQWTKMGELGVQFSKPVTSQVK